MSSIQQHPINKFVIIIILALFVPVLTYTIYQFTQIDENEQLMQSIYERQLESIIFSVNSWCRENFDQWHAKMTAAAVADLRARGGQSMIAEFAAGQRVIACAFARYSSDHFVIGFNDHFQAVNPRRHELMSDVNKIIADSSESLNIALGFAQKGYIRLLSMNWSTEKYDYSLLLFPLSSDIFPGDAIFAGLLIDNMTFINEIVERRFKQMTLEDEFDFAIQKKGRHDFFYYSTEYIPEEPFEESKPIWILADMDLKIKMAGTTLERMTKRRSRNNVMLLIAVNIVFIIGLIYVTRNVAKEMELAKIKSNLVANVSHEIRTPVALIRMYAETLEMGHLQDEAKKKKYYQTMVAESIRLTQLINNMLDFSKIESRKKEYRLSPHDLGDIVRQILTMYQYNFEQKAFQIEQKIAPNLPPVNIDSEATTQAIVNLLDNAMKYSLENKYICVSLEQRGQHIILSVTDHGIGIPESEHEKIFQKFYRVGDSLVHDTKGSGLGLSLVDHIMRVQNGAVTLKSRPGQGSTFSLVFPIFTQSGA
ncbi:HAMP domain-containing histidine kinase [candidate division KSB1 bacterium]|nr:HAMP domain-containing histidine kinase [candidate division KSB1 bacterium]